MRISKIVTYILISSAVICFILFKSLTPEMKTGKEKISSVKNSFLLKNFILTEYQKENPTLKKFSLKGKELTQEGVKVGLFSIGPFKVVRINGPEATYYLDKKIISQIRADKAILKTYFSKNKADSEILKSEIEFLGHVSVITEDKTVLTCKKLKLDRIKEQIYGEGKCVLSGNGNHLKGDIITSDIKLKNFNIKNDNKKRINALFKVF